MSGLALLPSGVLIWPCVAIVGFANIGWNGVYMTLVAEAAPSGQIGRVSGSSLRVVFAGAVVVPPLLGLVADHAGLDGRLAGRRRARRARGDLDERGRARPGPRRRATIV